MLPRPIVSLCIKNHPNFPDQLSAGGLSLISSEGCASAIIADEKATRPKIVLNLIPDLKILELLQSLGCVITSKESNPSRLKDYSWKKINTGFQPYGI